MPALTTEFFIRDSCLVQMAPHIMEIQGTHVDPLKKKILGWPVVKVSSTKKMVRKRIKKKF